MTQYSVVCQSIWLSRGDAVQKQQNRSISCLWWRLSEPKKHRGRSESWYPPTRGREVALCLHFAQTISYKSTILLLLANLPIQSSISYAAPSRFSPAQAPRFRTQHACWPVSINAYLYCVNFQTCTHNPHFCACVCPLKSRERVIRLSPDSYGSSRTLRGWFKAKKAEAGVLSKVPQLIISWPVGL